MSQLDLGKLELIRRWSQYAAAGVLVFFVVLLALAAIRLREINSRIAAGNETLLQQAERIKANDQKLQTQAQTIDSQQTTLKALINPSQQLNSDQARQVQQTVEKNIVEVGGEKMIAARIYMQIGDESQRKRAGEVVAQLQKKGYIVPGIENVNGKANLPRTSELRYYQTDSVAQQDIKDITQALSGLGIHVTSRSLTSNAVRPRHYELWFGQDF